MQGQISLHLYLKNTLRQGYCKCFFSTIHSTLAQECHDDLGNLKKIFFSNYFQSLSRSSRPGRSSQPGHSNNIGGILLGIIIYKHYISIKLQITFRFTLQHGHNLTHAGPLPGSLCVHWMQTLVTSCTSRVSSSDKSSVESTSSISLSFLRRSQACTSGSLIGAHCRLTMYYTVTISLRYCCKWSCDLKGR
jgi:hypothetical protein